MYKTTTSELRTLSGLAPKTYHKALDELEDLGLLEAFGLKELTVTIHDPFTGEPISAPDGEDEDDPANYFTEGKGKSKRLILNTGDSEQVEDLIRSSIPKGEPVPQLSHGDLMMRCPFHDDNTPSLSVSPSKRCFKCFGCLKTGTVTDLLAKLTNTTKAQTIQNAAASLGKAAVFREPDSNAIAKYEYFNEKGSLLKQVLRYPNDSKGNKVIRQRRPAAGG